MYIGGYLAVFLPSLPIGVVVVVVVVELSL